MADSYVPGLISDEYDAQQLQAEFEKVASATSEPEASLVYFVPQNVALEKPRDGMITYADGTNWNPGSGEGFYGRVGGVWTFLNAAGGGSGSSLTLSAETDLTNGGANDTSSWDFTISAGANRVTLQLQNMSTTGGTVPKVQLGDSGGIETTGYSSVGILATNGANPITLNTSADGFSLRQSTSGYDGIIVMTRVSGNKWLATGQGQVYSTAMIFTGGEKELSGELTTVRITTNNGTEYFDAGVASVIEETP